MSMTMLTVFQIIGVSAAYFGVTLALPWILLGGKFAQLRTAARFMACFVTGNFFCMNLVFLLQLLHISNRFTLVAGTLAPFIAVAVRRRQACLSALEKGLRSLRVVSEGEMGVKTLMLRTGRRMRKMSSGWLGEWLSSRWPDVLLTLGILGMLLYIYGVNAVNVYGYCSSDMVLHNYWINYMDQNRIFVDGVYPFGFHCVIYYLHEVFSVPVYVLLRVFALPQTLMIHMALFAFLKLVCKSRYTPYVGLTAYIMWGILYQYTYYRYYAPLPQEYGMMFVLPAVYFAIAFLQKKDILSGDGKKKKTAKDARLLLLLFAASVSLTLTVHFYDTIMAGLLCGGIAVGFCFRCFRWRYLGRLVLAGVTGILIAVLPMAAAYAMGTPLQGSLHWGMNMISAGGEDKEDSGENAQKEENKSPGKTEAGVSWKSLGTKLDHVLGEMQYYVTNDSRAAAEFMLGSVGVLLALGMLWYILRRPDYGAVLVSVGVFMGIASILQASAKLGLPQLMEVSRYSVYIGYGLPIVWSLCADAAVYLLFRERKGIHIGGLVMLGAACAVVLLTGLRKPVCISAYESNGAVTCVTNILRENPKGATWTICSSNDERQMIWGEGYHYEMIQFLRNLEEIGEDVSLTIPTDTVYFFIEKVPLLYLDYMNTIRPEKKVSLKGAATELPKSGGILPYIEEERWVTMSHMYYWARAFQELYPNEMEVYYETDEFICYRVRQNGYNLYDFAIDYGYNK